MYIKICGETLDPGKQVFIPEKGIQTLVASRLQRWAIILSAYSYKIEYKPTKEHGNADSLSRLPIGPDSNFEKGQSLSPVVNLIQDERLSQLPILAGDIAKATESDATLNQVMKLTQKGWPLSKNKLKQELHPYFNRQAQLTIHQGCILCGLRVVIPQSLRKQVLEEVQCAHAGVVRMKSLARMHVWWPLIDSHIEKCVQECQSCQENQRNPATVPLHPWEMSQQPWKWLHIDFAGPFEGQMWLGLHTLFGNFFENNRCTYKKRIIRE